MDGDEDEALFGIGVDFDEVVEEEEVMRPNRFRSPEGMMDESSDSAVLSSASPATSFKSMPAIFASSASDWDLTSLTQAAEINSRHNFQSMMHSGNKGAFEAQVLPGLLI